MRWRKLGLIYVPDGRQPWAQSHAMVPTPLQISDDVLRLYVAHLDHRSVGRVGYVDVALSDPTRVLAVADSPVFEIGEPGTFDDNGVVPACIVPVDGQLRLYYAGFQLQIKIPYTIFSGSATATTPDGPFRRLSRAPLLDRAEHELFFRAAPFVLLDGGKWRMWYISGGEWIQPKEKKVPSYSLRHIESDNGIDWSAPSVVCLRPDGPGEIGFGRPFVIRDGPDYRMWYSIRKVEGYRLGYATSPDGLNWSRRDKEVGIDCSETGWDSEMICFAAVVPTEQAWLMFYNGNGYGRTGFGVAVAESE